MQGYGKELLDLHSYSIGKYIKIRNQVDPSLIKVNINNNRDATYIKKI